MNKIVEWLTGSPGDGGGTWSFRFVSEYGPYLNLLIIVVLAALVYLTIRSYRREGDNPPRIKAILAALRIAVILLLVAVLMRPALVLRTVKTLQSVVVVLADDSLSMSNKDKYEGDPNYQKQLAKYLNLQPDELDKFSRSEILRKVLQRKGGAVAKLVQDHSLHVHVFSSTQPSDKQPYTRRIEVIEPTGDGADKQQAGGDVALARFSLAIEKNLNANGFQTNYAAALRDALENEQGQRIAGVIILGDGQPTNENSERSMQSALAFARDRGVQLYTVGVGDPTQPRNVSVVSLQAPREVRKDSSAEFAAIVSHRNLAGTPLNVRLEVSVDEKKWDSTGISSTVTLDGAAAGSATGSRGTQNVAIKVPADKIAKVGSFHYRAVIDPVKGELNADDNAASANVRVVDNKINVLLISGDSGWEFQYLRNFLMRQPELYKLSVWQQNADPEVGQASSTPEMRLERMPRTLEDLKGDGKKKPGYQVIILYDPRVEKEGFDAKFMEELKKFVGTQSGGLCFIAGNKHSDDTAVNTGAFKDLRALLPVELAPNTGADWAMALNEKLPEPWPVQPTSYALDHQITRLGSNAQESSHIWNNLPGIFWSHPVMKVKPLARVLLENSNPQRRSGQGSEPLLAVQMYGRGPVVYVGTDDTWRWRAVEDSAYYRKFWNNMLSFLSALRTSRVVITCGGDTFNAGEKIQVEVEAYDEKYVPLKDATFQIDVLRKENRDSVAHGDISLVQQFDKDKQPTGKFKGSFTPTRTGKYVLTSKVKDTAFKEITVKLPEEEMVRTEANEENLKAMATRSFHRIHEFDQLAREIPADRLTSEQLRPFEIWNSQILLAILVVLLAAEWILRKKYNMA